MAKNITENQNYIIFDDEGTAGLKVFPKSGFYSESSDAFTVSVDVRSKDYIIGFTDAGNWYTASDGVTAFTETTLRTFLQTYTGL